MERMKSSPFSTRRGVLAGMALLALAGCGFELRRAPVFAFKSIAVKGNSATVALLRRNLKSTGTLEVIPPGQADTAEAILEVLGEDRSRVVISTDSAGLVREMDLLFKFRFKLTTPAGRELLGPTTLEQRRDLTYNETNAIAKESEADLLYRDMQTDVAQQVLRRIAAVK